MFFSRNFWIDETGEVIPCSEHWRVVEERLMDPEDDTKPSLFEYYRIAMLEHKWIRAVDASDGYGENICVAQVGSLGRGTMKRLAKGFYNAYGEAVYDAEFVIDVGIDDGYYGTLSSDFWSLDSGEVPRKKWTAGTWLDRGMRKEAVMFRAAAKGDPCNNPGLYKGRRFFCGAFDPLDGYIEEIRTWEEAKASGFHHSFYFSPHIADAINNEELIFFWIDRNTGELGLWWRDDNTGYEALIKDQIEINVVPHDQCDRKPPE